MKIILYRIIMGSEGEYGYTSPETRDSISAVSILIFPMFL